MTRRRQHHEIPAEHRAQEHLANERTFLAWIRTTIALISLGFVLTRVGPWLSDHTMTATAQTKLSPIGVGLIIFGSVVTLLAAWRYDAVNREIEAGFVKTDRVLVWFVATAVTVLSIALIIYIFLGSGAQ